MKKRETFNCVNHDEPQISEHKTVFIIMIEVNKTSWK